MSTHAIAVGTGQRPAVSRREFLKGTGVLVGTLWTTSGALLALAPSSVWALEMKSLEEPTGKALLVFTRGILPHAKLDDAVYALVVKDLDAEAAATPATRTLLVEGVAALDQAAGGSFAGLPAAKQSAIVKAMAGTPLFEKVRGKAIVSLYNNELAFVHFGYEGNAFEHGGGYLLRGFNDLKWLPAPPLAASPNPYAG